MNKLLLHDFCQVHFFFYHTNRYDLTRRTNNYDYRRELYI